MDPLEIRHYRVLNQLYKTRSVSRTGENMGMSQPSVSIVLGQLRRRFGDPLFVRTSAGMQPTPHAEFLAHRIAQALELLDMSADASLSFQASSSDRVFRLCMTDVGQIVLLPMLLNKLKDVAPSVRIEMRNLSRETPKVLESGEADLAMGFMPAMQGGGFYQRLLFRESFVCLARADHPRIRGTLGKQQFLDEGHVAVMPSGTGHQIVDRVLEKKNIRRNVALWVPSFLRLEQIVGCTDMLAIVPRRLGRALAAAGRVRLYSPPVELPDYPVRQIWHARYHNDPGNRWLRALITDLLAT